MSKKFNTIVIIIFLGSFSSILKAQHFTNPQRRYINLQVYSLLESYARYGKLSTNYKTIDETYLNAFSSLFEPSAMVFNDILPYNKLDHSIPVKEYLKLAGKYYPSGLGFRLHNIQIAIPSEQSPGKYGMNVHLQKEIYGATAQNANYKDTLSLTFNIEFKLVDSVPTGFLIEGIDGQEVGRTLRLLVLEGNTSEPVPHARISFNDQTYYTNNSGRIELKNLDPNQTYRYSIKDKKYGSASQSDFYIDDILSSKIQSDPAAKYFDPNEIVERLSTPSQLVFLSLHFAPPVISNAIHLDGLQNSEQTDSSEYSYLRSPNYYFGFRTGYNFFSNGKSHVSLILGIEYFHYSSRVEITDSLSQLIRTSGFSFPLHLGMKYNLDDRLSLNIESGINLNFQTENSYKNIANSDSPTVTEEQNWRANNIFNFYISPSISWDLTNEIEIYGGPSLIMGLNELSGQISHNPLITERSTLRAWSIELGLRYRFTGMNHSSNNR